MKTYVLSISAVLLCLLLVHCAVRIPAVDNNPPVLTFEITIPGQEPIMISSEEEFEFIQINVEENSRYTFRYTARDDGGLRIMQMQYGSNYQISGLAESISDIELSLLSRMLEWQGDRERPVNAMIAAGSIRTENLEGSGGTAGGLLFFASDYGGSSGTPNSTTMDINIMTVPAGQATGIVSRY